MLGSDLLTRILLPLGGVLCAIIVALKILQFLMQYFGWGQIKMGSHEMKVRSIKPVDAHHKMVVVEWKNQQHLLVCSSAHTCLVATSDLRLTPEDEQIK